MWRRSLQTLPTVMTFLHLQTQCHFYTSRAFGSGSQATPQYNHGLPGKGKGSKRKGKGNQHTPIRTEGEVVFGVHPVTLALSSPFRSHLYRLYMDRKHRDQSSHTSHGHSSDTFHQSPDSFHQPRGSFHHIQQLAASRQIPVQYVPKNTLTELSGNRPHQGVCLDASPRLLPDWDPQHLLQPGEDLRPSVLWLLLYSVQDPMNCGAILRSSYFLGVDRVIIPRVNSCALTPVVSKASAGAMEVMDLQSIDGSFCSVRQLTQVWQSHGGRVVGTTSAEDCRHSVHPLQKMRDTAPTLLIVGNEGSGIDADVEELCDALLTIPPPHSFHSPPVVSSLNVSVATGIVIHWLRMASLPSSSTPQ